MRLRWLIVPLLLVAACDSSPAVETAPPPETSSTTTTIDDDDCEKVAEATVDFLEDLIDELDETRLRELLDRGAWPEDLADLERQGRDLDLRSEALRCDPAVIQQHAFREADLDPDGPLSEYLLELLLPAG